jgi:hypothetical protein
VSRKDDLEQATHKPHEIIRSGKVLMAEMRADDLDDMME